MSTNKSSASLKNTTDVLYRVKRGLAGYVSYLAACEMNEAFSEYVLYEPILRILTARGFSVECEYICPGVQQPKRGDKKKIDFYASNKNTNLAFEVKWMKTARMDISADLAKLEGIKKTEPRTVCLLCLFGRQSLLDSFDSSTHNLKERGKPRVADLGATRYGCRIFEIKPNAR